MSERRERIPESQLRRARSLPRKFIEEQKLKLPTFIRHQVDWEQVDLDAQLALLQAEQTWRPDGGAAFSTWAYQKVRITVQESVRNLQFLTRKCQEETKELLARDEDIPEPWKATLWVDQTWDYDGDNEMALSDCLYDTKSVNAYERAEWRILLDQIFAGLRFEDRAVLKAHIGWGRGQMELCDLYEETGKSPSIMQQRIRKAIRIARDEACALGIMS